MLLDQALRRRPVAEGRRWRAGLLLIGALGLYALGSDPTGPLFALLFLAVIYAGAVMSARAGVGYTGLALLLAAGVVPVVDTAFLIAGALAAAAFFDADRSPARTIRELADALYRLRVDNPYGFKATFNPTYPAGDNRPYGWISPYHFGLNQGPIVIMIENYRTGLTWDRMRACAPIQAGLRRAGFAGGWLGPATGA